MASCVAVASPVSAGTLGSGGDVAGNEVEYDETELEDGGIEQEIEVRIDAKDVADVANPKQREKILDMPTKEPFLGGSSGGSMRDDDNQKIVYENESHSKRSPVEDANALILDDVSPTKRNDIVVNDTETTPKTSKAMGAKHTLPRFPGKNSKSKKRRFGVQHDGSKKKIKVPCQFYAKGWCIKGTSCRFLHMKDGVEYPKSNIQTMNMDFPRVVGGISVPFDKVSSLEGYSSASLLRDGCPETDHASSGNMLTCSSASLHDSHSCSRISAFGTRLNEDKIGMVAHDKRLLDGSMANQSTSFGFTPWKLGNPHGYLESSFPRSTLFLSPDFGGSSQPHQIADREPAAHDAMFPSYAWEPSIPFEPSHAVTRALLLKEFPQGIKDNGIGETHLSDEHLKLTSSGQVSSVKDLKTRSDASAGRDNFEDGAQTGETVGAEPMGSSHDSGSRVEKLNNEVEVNADASGTKGEDEAACKGEEQMNFEAKALMCFKSALAEYVKELVKPTWREGLMSKDAHKLIVKKSVDKVMSTIQPYQIPATNESIHLYLSSSHSKLAKLVEAYIEIHGKS